MSRIIFFVETKVVFVWHIDINYQLIDNVTRVWPADNINGQGEGV